MSTDATQIRPKTDKERRKKRESQGRPLWFLDCSFSGFLLCDLCLSCFLLCVASVLIRVHLWLMPSSPMAEDRTFMMGKYPAVLPGELLYARNHMWCGPGNGRWRFGFTAYAVRLVKDVYFLEWVLSAGDTVHLLQHIGHIETSKANSDLFAPADGVLAEFNAALLDDPAGINADGHGAGWLFEMEA